MGSSGIAADALTTCALAARLGDLPEGHHVVYAHSAPDRRRGALAGLSWLEENLASGEPLEGSITVAGFPGFQELGPFHYLFEQPRGGIAYVQLLENLCHLPKRLQLDKEQRLRVRRVASERVLERFFSAQRHEFKGLAAAVRVYLGMLAEGHAPVDEAEKTLSEMAAAAKDHPDCGPEPQVDGARVARLVSQHRMLLEQVGSRQHSAQPALRLAMLDDHVHDHLWSSVLPHICTGGGFMPFATWEGESGLHAALDSLPTDTVLLLDCNLGEDSPTGLELLQPIRAARPEILVVMLSAFDDAPLALAAMRAGANDFFVKELTDAGDRSSQRYYQHFLATVRRGDPNEARLRQLWRSVATSPASGELDADVRRDMPSTMRDQLSSAFALAFSLAEANPVANMRHAWGNAMHRDTGWPAVAVLASGWHPLPKPSGDPQHVIHKGSSKRRALEEHFRAVHHLDGKRSVSMADAAKCLEDITRHCIRLPLVVSKSRQKPAMPAFSPYAPSELRSDLQRPGQTDRQMGSTHESAEERAAYELLSGWQAVTGLGPTEPSAAFDGMLVLDDRASQSGWSEAVSDVLPGARIVQQAPGEPDGLEHMLRGVRAVMLDLHLPDAQDGLRILRQILECDPSVPVVAMSASTDALNATRALKTGAVDFVPKAMPYARSHDQCVEFAFGLRARARLVLRLGDPNGGVRGLLRAMSELEGAVRAWSLQPEVTKRWASISREPWPLPPPDRWADILIEHVALVATLYRWHWLLTAKEEVEQVAGATPAMLIPFDGWRLWALGASGLGCTSEAATRVLAVLTGGLLELATQWLVRWEGQELVGGPDYRIVDHIRDRFGPKVVQLWHLRKAALGQSTSKHAWGQGAMELCVELLLAVLDELPRGISL